VQLIVWNDVGCHASCCAAKCVELREVAVIDIDNALAFAFALPFTFGLKSVTVGVIVVIVVVVAVVVIVVVLGVTFTVGGFWFMLVPLTHFVYACLNFGFDGFSICCLTVPIHGSRLALAYKMPVPVYFVPWVVVREVCLERFGYRYSMIVDCYFVIITTIVVIITIIVVVIHFYY
jgi:hypothetical protein